MRWGRISIFIWAWEASRLLVISGCAIPYYSVGKIKPFEVSILFIGLHPADNINELEHINP